MGEIPLYVSLTFIAVVIATFGFLVYAARVASPGEKDFSPTVIGTYIIVLLFVTALLSYNGYYLNFNERPPRLIISILVVVASIVVIFSTKAGRSYVQKMPLTTLTYIHIIRVPVEIVLWWLYKEGQVGVLLTFEGINYDIVSGITAPFAGLFLVGMRSKSKFGALAWNVIALGLLVSIVYHAVLSTPYPFQKFGFEQPNVAVFHFPYIWLPTFVVPAVLFCHIASIYKLITSKDEEEVYD